MKQLSNRKNRYPTIFLSFSSLWMLAQVFDTLPMRTQRFNASDPLNVASVVELVAGNGIKASTP
jgi:hypothetical protein